MRFFGSLFVLLLTIGSEILAADPVGAADCDVYIGTYTRGDSEGIYRFRMDGETGILTAVGTTGGIKNPSFLALSPDGGALYSVSEVNGGGGVTAFKRDPNTGDLTKLNSQTSGGRGACHVDVSPDGKFVAVANYGGGSTAVLAISENGAIGDSVGFFQHKGSSINPRRQQGPHAHCVNFDPEGNRLAVADLGLDRILLYDVSSGNNEKPQVRSGNPPFTAVTPGAGPRHFAFHPGGEYAYVINELDSTVTAFHYAADVGALTTLQTRSTLPKDFEDQNTTAEIFLTPDGKFLIGSNRGHDSLVVFAIDTETGLLSEPIGWTSTGGQTPRNFNIHPSGRFVIACNQNSNSVVGFRFNADTGALTPTGQVLDVPNPVCVVFQPINE